ncbi:hypothetical protein THAOC_27281, partial [Thalassiosira oceanica]
VAVDSSPSEQALGLRRVRDGALGEDGAPMTSEGSGYHFRVLSTESAAAELPSTSRRAEELNAHRPVARRRALAREGAPYDRTDIEPNKRA